MAAASILIKPASANCNIDCAYCFYKCLSSRREEYSKGFMRQETLRALVENAAAYGDDLIAFAFQGGEPTLCGVDFFREAVRLQQEYRRPGQVVENSIQTNGLLLDEEWAKFLAEEDFLGGISLDGPKKIHDRYRKDASGRGTFAKVMQSISLLRRYGVRFNILTVVTEEAAQKASYLYDFYKRNGFDYIQLIPCMDESGRGQSACANTSAVTPDSYGRFLCEIFDRWYADFDKGANMDIRMFSNLAQMAAGYPAEECGMSGQCSCYFVTEGDGSVYPCDFYCSDRWKLGTVKEPFAELAGSKKAQEFLAASGGMAERCRVCPWFSLCRGGCRRRREEDGAGRYGCNQLCPSYEMFFAHTWERLQKLGERILRYYGPYKG